MSQPEKESRFEQVIRARIEPRIKFVTEKSEYDRLDYVSLWVENGTNLKIYFADRTLGLSAYQYDNEHGTWCPVEVSAKMRNPERVMVAPGPRQLLPFLTIPMELIAGSGDIRLVITGIDEDGRRFAAYKDVMITD